jgi:hypothetical protein
MLKKALKMNQVGARDAEKHANNNVTAILVIEMIALCLRLFALPAGKRQQYRSSPPVTDQYIAETVSRLRESVTTKNTCITKGFSIDILKPFFITSHDHNRQRNNDYR